MGNGRRTDDWRTTILFEDLCEEAKADFDDKLTKAQASKRIEELQATTGRGSKKEGDIVDEGLVSPDPTGDPGSLGNKDRSIHGR